MQEADAAVLPPTLELQLRDAQPTSSRGENASHPRCAHGPTLLFVAHADYGEIDEEGATSPSSSTSSATSATSRSYFACSAFRDRRLCPFFLWADEWVAHAAASPTQPTHRERAVEATATPERAGAATRGGVKLSANAKGLAQFMFDSAALDLLTGSLRRLGFARVLCLGTPRLHERLLESDPPDVQSLLLDLDPRFAPFFGSTFVRFNMGNGHFFDPADEAKVDAFMAGCDCIVLDPPYGMLVSSLVATLRQLSHRKVSLAADRNRDHYDYECLDNVDTGKIGERRKRAATEREGRDGPDPRQAAKRLKALRKGGDGGGVEGGDDPPPLMPVMWMCPFYYEERIKRSLPSFDMLEYQVGYDNHPLFNRETTTSTASASSDGLSNSSGSGSARKERGRRRRARRRTDRFAFSPVRIFTNVRPLRDFVLPEEDGYRLCAVCDRYVCPNNRHCEACGKCTSKDGRRWRHCDECGACVPPGRTHCGTCGRCEPPQHIHASVEEEEEAAAKRMGCFTCGAAGHKKRQCPATKRRGRHREKNSKE